MLPSHRPEKSNNADLTSQSNGQYAQTDNETNTTSSQMQLDTEAELDTSSTTSSIPSSPMSHFSDETLDLPPATNNPVIHDTVYTPLTHVEDQQRTRSPPPPYSEGEEFASESLSTQDHQRQAQRHQQEHHANPARSSRRGRGFRGRPNESRPFVQNQFPLSNSPYQGYGTTGQRSNHSPHASESYPFFAPQFMSGWPGLDSFNTRSARPVKTAPIPWSSNRGQPMNKWCCCCVACYRFAVLIVFFVVATLFRFSWGGAWEAGPGPGPGNPEAWRSHPRDWRSHHRQRHPYRSPTDAHTDFPDRTPAADSAECTRR